MPSLVRFQPGTSRLAGRLRAIRMRCRLALMWIRYRIDPRCRYHVVKTRLEPGFYDHDERMVAAMVAVFLEFMEAEPFAGWDDEDIGEQSRQVKARCMNLYAYFKDRDVTCVYDEGEYAELTRHLLELVYLRKSFWC